MTGVTYSDKFASFCRIHHGDGRVLDYMGTDTANGRRTQCDVKYSGFSR